MVHIFIQRDKKKRMSKCFLKGGVCRIHLPKMPPEVDLIWQYSISPPPKKKNLLEDVFLMQIKSEGFQVLAGSMRRHRVLKIRNFIPVHLQGRGCQSQSTPALPSCLEATVWKDFGLCSRKASLSSHCSPELALSTLLCYSYEMHKDLSILL